MVFVQVSGPGTVWHISFMTVSSTSCMTTEQVVVVAVVVVVEAVVVVWGKVTGASPGGVTSSGSGMPHWLEQPLKQQTPLLGQSTSS